MQTLARSSGHYTEELLLTEGRLTTTKLVPTGDKGGELVLRAFLSASTARCVGRKRLRACSNRRPPRRPPAMPTGDGEDVRQVSRRGLRSDALLATFVFVFVPRFLAHAGHLLQHPHPPPPPPTPMEHGSLRLAIYQVRSVGRAAPVPRSKPGATASAHSNR